MPTPPPTAIVRNAGTVRRALRAAAAGVSDGRNMAGTLQGVSREEEDRP